ncbi:MAG: hypothetical protein JRH20_27725, partial [Deltaproteobacteria bacterium]|nr:hypothetical protein [Deltaproteobacteria bacterium]
AKRVEGHFSQMGVLACAGEITTTGNAMLKLLSALTGESGVLPSAIEEAVKPLMPLNAEDQIAYAVEVQPETTSGPIYKKAGATAGGFSSYLAFRRSPQVGVMVMSNCGGFTPKTLALAVLAELMIAP